MILLIHNSLGLDTGRSIAIDSGKILLTAETVIPLIIGTTIHAQDFRDVEGDKLKGRTTLPIAYPRGSRWSVLVAILGWSVALARWTSMVHWALKIAYVTMGACVGCVFVLHAKVENDRKSYDAYNVSKSDIFLPFCLMHATFCV